MLDDGRSLYNYVHVDYSEKFGHLERSLLLIAWIFSLVAIGRARKTMKGWVALSSGVVLYSFLLRWYFGSHPPSHDPYDEIYYFRPSDQLPTEPIVFLFAMAILTAVLRDYFPSFVNDTLRRGNFLTKDTYLSLWDAMSTLLRSFWAGGILSQDTYASLVLSSSSSGGDHEATSSLSSSSSPRLMMIELLQGVGSSLGSAFTVNGNLHSLLIASYLAYDNISWREYNINMARPIFTILLLVIFIVVVGVMVTPGWRGGINIFAAARTTSSTGAGYYEGVSTTMDDVESAFIASCMKGGEESSSSSSPTAQAVVLDGEDDTKMESSSPLVVQVQNLELEPTTTTTTTTRTLLGSKNDNHSIQKSSFSFWIVVGAFALLILGYAMNFDIPGVALTVVLALFWVGRYFLAPVSNDNNETNATTVVVEGQQQGLDLAGKLDLDPILMYTGIALVTLVLDETGVPQAFYNRIVSDYCVERLLEGACVYQHAVILYVQATVVSPLVTAFMLAATFPYASPMVWIRASFCLSMGVVARSLIGLVWNLRKMYTSKITKWVGVVVAVLTPVPFVILGLHILTVFPFAKDCSERLGECQYRHP